MRAWGDWRSAEGEQCSPARGSLKVVVPEEQKPLADRADTLQLMTATAPDPMALAELWEPVLFDLSCRLRRASRSAIQEALASGSLGALSSPVGVGAGDVTFGLDAACEHELTDWLLEQALHGPLSVLTEDAGWRHLGPGDDASSGPVELPGFDHGGPRIVVDPVDGTRHLAFDLRSAWTVLGLAGPGDRAPLMSELVLGEVSELPDSRGAHYRRLWATLGGGCRFELRALEDDVVLRKGALVADDDDRVDHAYLPFFAYHPDTRSDNDRLAAGFYARIEASEGADLAQCYDDQYIASGGQIALLALGTYRMIVDARPHLATLRGRATQTAHAYDLAGAVLCAREAGCVLTALDGGTLDFPMEPTGAVGFVGFANGRTGARLLPHLLAALESFRTI